MTPELEGILKRGARIELARQCAADGDVLGWGQALMPDKFRLPFCDELHGYLAKIRAEPFTSTEAPRGHAKCQDPESLVLGTFGVKRAKDLVAGDMVYSIDDENKVCVQRVVAVAGAQNKAGYVLKTRSGRRVKISAGHRMFMFDGYREVEDIHPGDYIGALNCVIDGPIKIPDAEMKFIAYMIFDGYCGTAGGQKNHKSFASGCPAVREDFRKVLAAVGLWENKNFNPIDIRVTSQARLLLSKHGVNDQSSKVKRLPSAFFALSFAQKIAFLSVMLDTDGFVAVEAGSWGITLANEGLIDDLQLLMATCGIVSTKRAMESSYKRADGTRFRGKAWGLLMNPAYGRAIVDAGLCKTDKAEKIRSLMARDRYSLTDMFPNGIKKNVRGVSDRARAAGVRVDNGCEMTRGKLERLAAVCPHPEFDKNLRQDIFWDRVVSVEPTGIREDFVDIQVEGTENYFANGLVSHNTTVGCVLLPLYQGLVEPERFRHYLNVQSNDDKALTVNRTIKAELEQNPLIKELYGDQIGERWTDACFVTKKGVVYSAVGCGASIRGINYRNIRPDWCVNDDFYNTEEDTNNPNGTVKKNDWFWGTLYSALAQDHPTSMHFQGTAVNREDLFEKLRMDPTVMSRTFRAVKDWDTKEVLWKGLKTFEQFEQMRTRMGSLIFSREFQNERRDDSTSIVKRNWLYPDNGNASWEYDAYSLKFDAHFQYQAGIVALDPSIGKRVSSDKSGYARVIRAQRDDGSLPVFFIEAIINAHHSFQERIDTMRELTSNRSPERPITKARVETVAGFADIGDRVAASIAVPCELIPHVSDKITNLERKSALFENHRVFLNKHISQDIKDELTYQLTTNHPKHDDIRDAVLLALDDEDGSNWGAWL